MRLLLAALLLAVTLPACARPSITVLEVRVIDVDDLDPFDTLRVTLSPPGEEPESREYGADSAGTLSATLPARISGRIGVAVEALAAGQVIASGDSNVTISPGEQNQVDVALALVLPDGGPDGGDGGPDGDVPGDGADADAGPVDMGPDGPTAIELGIGQPCKTGSDCQTALCPSNGICTLDCTASRECPVGSRCVRSSATSYRCLLDCTVDSDCPVASLECRNAPGGKVCDGERAIGGYCENTDDCFSGNCFNINTPNGYCFDDCTTNLPCPSGATCKDYGGKKGTCLANCQDDTDCRSDEGFFCDDTLTTIGTTGATQSVCNYTG